jgi:hypothetical protein
MYPQPYYDIETTPPPEYKLILIEAFVGSEDWYKAYTDGEKWYHPDDRPFPCNPQFWKHNNKR